MALKKLKLSVPGGKRPVDPLELFNRLTLRGSIENIWEPQGEALKDWHRKRGEPDVVVRMNTGGGKTLVGLLMAQSLVNETHGHVLYVCANNQLVEQTLDKAGEIGMVPAVRYKGAWSGRDGFDSGDVFCVTNYAAVFNGKSIFAGGDIQGLVFDDAHVAENTIRGCFSLRIPTDHEAHGPMLGLFRKHFANSSQASHFQDISDNHPAPILFVPMFVVWQHADAVRKLLLEAGVDKTESTLFAWEHLRDHLNHCCILADRNGIEITPAVLPLRQLAIFAPGVRRIYLTATLPSQTAFARAFGIATSAMVEPSGKSGDAQRLFVFVPGEDDEDQRNSAKELVAERKCCVISPSRRKAEEWVPPSQIYTDGGQAEIDRFAESTAPEMLGLVARYDGIDLPGDACKVLIVDRLPSGETLLDRFIDQSIRVEAIRTSHTATRIVQAIGRIFRSNTDHGIVLLVGPELQSWIRNPRNAGHLPKLLQQQVLLGTELGKQVASGEVTYPDLIDGLLAGEENWDETYNEYIDQFEAQVLLPDVGWFVSLVHNEHQAYEDLWQGQCGRAADLYARLADAAQKDDPRLAAWYHHWRGLALMCADERESALRDFVLAANVRSELGRPSVKRESAFKAPKVEQVGAQAKNLASWYRKNKAQIAAVVTQVETDLQYGEDTAKAEEAVRQLGQLLGIHAERPDKSKGTGPDVLWLGEGAIEAWGFELKTNKATDGEYSKADISQCHDHEEYLRSRHKDKARLAIIGRSLPVSAKAHPSPQLRVIEVDAFRDILCRAKAVLESVEAGDKANLEQAFQGWLEFYGLIWPGCVAALDSRLAVDLRDNE